MQQLEPDLSSENITSNLLQFKLLQLKETAYSGSLKVKTTTDLSWTLNFRLGRLSWSTGESNLENRFQRQLTFCCPEIVKTELKKFESQTSKNKECEFLVQLQRKQLIQKTQLTSLMINVAIEVLFDILQYINQTRDRLSFEINFNDPNSKLGLLLPFIETEIIFKKATKAWQQWQGVGLGAYSPNLFPIIQQPTQLQKQIISREQQQVISLINGTQNLRDLALKSRQNIVSLTQSLIPLVDLGVISFSSVPIVKSSDFQVIEQENTANSNSLEKSPLIACVDDSPLICQALEKIITKQGYRFICIQQPIKVIPTLLKNKPDFIFLDLLMPIINGYELCAQLRRTPSLQNIPIVILTGKDGLVDRMRAKLVGSTDFLSKPVESELVLNILDKFLAIKK
ncbi:response regulator receiver protein [Stanieria cyanosphaera PCC 7437]|uniref:Response regulator receiver protein n=1 Tax=Stanieria cyanosphaera (strain ATCC 29371 / PCC 7437) TaxID=111780 RepID=K9XYD8_STAC7|nr:response regulator [Stanieria cyanosphaera]AFZ37548.1 response regulator receiver protein [Stanieria cyanosphaera PCC 7437]